MAKVNGREDALLNAYLNRYKTAQASNVSAGRSTTRKAQQQGSAIMNATDKTLPVLHNSYTETLNNIVQGANLENSLNNDILNRQMKLAQAKFDAANDLYQQQQKAQQYAAKKAAKAAKSSGKSSGKGGSTTGTGSDTESAASLDSLFGGGASNSGTTGSTAGSKPKAEDTEKPKTKSEKEKSAQEKYLEAKKAGARTTSAKSYAERNGTGRVNAAQPAQSRAVTRGGKVIGSSYAAAGSAPSAAETQAAKDKRNDYKSQQEDIASALKKLQSNADYRAELAAPGRKLTSAEVAAVNQYEKSTKNTGFSGLKRVFETAANKEGLSQEDYAKKAAAMNAELNQNSALRGKAQMNGAGQTAQAFTAGLYDSVPFLRKSVDKLTDIANETGAELPQLSNAIEGAKSYDPLAAAAGTLVGKGMQYNLFNTAMAGTPLAQTMGKAGNAVVGQAQKIPVLGDALGAGAGDALGRILTDTTADLALDTLPSLVNDVSDGKSVGEIAGNTAKNIASNVAMNALPEIGGALFNRLKGTAGDAAQDALKQADDAAPYILKQADNAVQDAQSAAPARNIVQPEANGTTGLAAQIQQMNTPDAANRSALNTLDELRGQANLNGAQEKEAEQLRRAVLQRQQEIGDEAKLALQNTDSLPIDAQRAASLQDSRAQSVAARPLNGSDSVPAHAVGAESTQYNRNEVLNQDYANQRVMRGDMDEQTAAGIGIGEQTHTVYSRAEGRDTASQDFDVLVQQTGSVTGAGRTVADELNRKIQNGQWDASDVYAGSHAAEQLRQRLAELPEGSAEADVVKAQIANINRAVSAGQSKAGQALVSGRYAQPDEYSGIRRFEQYTQNSVDRFANTRQGQQLHDVAQEVADTMNGPMDDEFTAFVHSQGVDTGDDVRDQLEYMAEQIQRMGRARNVNINEEQARAAAARLQAGGTGEDIYGAFARQALGIGDLSQEDLDYAVDTFRRISDMPDSRERYDLEMSVYGRMANYMPARGFADRLNNIRYLCMLGNSRTHIRNMMGNVMMGTVTRAKDNIAGVMQLALPQNERTKAVGTMLTSDGRRMVNRARDYADNQMYSILYQDGRWNMDTGLQAARNTYATPVGRAIGRLSDINGGALEAEDNFFLRSAFGNSMASFLKARGYDSSIFDATDEHSRSVLRQAAAQALEDAREATFHEDNFLSTAFRNFSNDTRRHGPAGQIAYAVAEGILPFKKTPINIAKNALEYNPIGGAVEAIYRGATGQGATRVMDAAAKGVTGTAILGAGYLLAKNGMLTGGASGDDRADNYSEMLGDQNYAVKIPGKGTYTLDWASPSSVPLLIGAQIAKDQEDGGEFNLTQTLDKMRQITQPVLETTMLQGLNDTLDSVSYADSNDKLATLATSALGSFANQFVPTALGQVARTVDDTRRSSYGGGDTKTERDIGYNIRKMENKIPGLSKNNEPYIDQWGREEASLDGTDDSAEGMFLRGAYNMLSPGYVSAENITPVDEYLQELYDSTNDSHVLPEKASSQIKVDGEGYYMTPEEKTEYAKTSGQTAYDLIDELRQNSMFLQLPEDQQSALVQDAYTVAKTAGGVAAVGDGVSGVNAKEYEAYRDGGAEGFSQYVLMKNATDLVRDEKRETSGNDDATLNTVEKWNTLYSQFGDDAVSNFVDSTDDDSTVHNISNLAGDKAVTAYMQAYSAVAKTLDDDQTPDKFTVGYGMQKYGLSGDDFARAYLAAYYKKDKNGKYPEKGGTYADKAGAEIYQSYGADALRDWVNYRATIPDTNGNGKADKAEAVARLKEMDLTNEMRRTYLAKTNKQWGKKNPF